MVAAGSVAAKAEEWAAVVSSLERLPVGALQLREASPWHEGRQEAFLTLHVVAGEVYDYCRLCVCLARSGEAVEVQLLSAADESEEVPEGIIDAVAEVGAPSTLRTAIRRLCGELCVELDNDLSRALAACEEVPAPVLLNRLRSGASTVSCHSFESNGHLAFSEDEDESPDASPSHRTKVGQILPTIHQGRARSADEVEPDRIKVARVAKPALAVSEADCSVPKTEDAVAWRAVLDGLRRIPDAPVELRSAGNWDGREGLIDVALKAHKDCPEWDELRVVLFVHSAKPTSAQIKGAQVLPDAVRFAVEEANNAPGEDMVGPLSVGRFLHRLCGVLCLDAAEDTLTMLDALGQREKTILLAHDACEDAFLCHEQQAVGALRTQLDVLSYQSEHVERRLGGPVDEEVFLLELGKLRRTFGEVTAEKEAGSRAVQAALLKCQSTSGQIELRVQFDDRRPCQSLRGLNMGQAEDLIKNSLSSSGPWGHYAAHQFAMMLSREQDLHGEFICLYHSYSCAALLYEVQAEVARHMFELREDLAPVPRVHIPKTGNPCKTLTELKALGGQDGRSEFQAMGLSASCSVFAHSSEAPPLTCFMGGYSANSKQFRDLIRHLLVLCAGPDRAKGAKAATDAVMMAAEQHQAGFGNCRNGLTGYMLQIFINRSIVENVAYPSQPMGVKLKGSMMDYLKRKDGQQADGQARILFHPALFFDPSKARLFHYCARPLQSCMDPAVPGSRGAFLRDLRKALEPVFRKVTSKALQEVLLGTPKEVGDMTKKVLSAQLKD